MGTQTNQLNKDFHLSTYMNCHGILSIQSIPSITHTLITLLLHCMLVPQSMLFLLGITSNTWYEISAGPNYINYAFTT